MSLATVTAFPSAPPSPPSAATPTGEPPVYLHGTIAQAMPDEIVVLVEGSAYNVRLTPSTLVLSATPRHPYPTGADVILAGHFDEVSRTGVAYQIWVNFIHVRGLIVQVFPDAEGITLTVQDLETRRPTQVRLAHEPVIPALIGMEGERVASLDVLEWSQVNQAEVFGMQNLNGTVVPITVQLSFALTRGASPLPATEQGSHTIPPQGNPSTARPTPIAVPPPTPTPAEVVLGGRVLAVQPDRLIITTTGGIVAPGKYMIEVTQETEIMKAHPERPIEVGEDVMLVGTIDPQAKTGTAVYIAVHAVNVFGDISQITPDVRALSFTVIEQRTKVPYHVELQGEPEIEYELFFHFTRIPELKTIPWDLIDQAEVSGYLGTDGIVAPTQVTFLSRWFLIPPHR